VAFNLKSYENQAKLSVYLAVLGGLAALGVIGLMGRNFDRISFFVTYNPKGFWLPLVGTGLLLGLGAGTAGFFVGLHSAGQRRNPRSALSWKGFFLNALVIMIMLSAGIFFYFTRNAMVTK
jgi:hypothetical protein